MRLINILGLGVSSRGYRGLCGLCLVSALLTGPEMLVLVAGHAHLIYIIAHSLEPAFM